MSSGGGGTSTNSTVQTQQIPEYEQQFSQQNQQLAQSLGSQAYPQYQGALIAPQNTAQQAGQQQAIGAASDYQPYLNAANSYIGQAGNATAFNNDLAASNSATGSALDPAAFNAYEGAASNQIGTGLNAATVTGAENAQAGATQQAQALTNPNAVANYMNPFVQQALAPQISDLNLQLAGQQNTINSQAAQAGAFGDARQGAAQGMQNYFGNQALNQLIGTGYNNAYTQALSALGQAQGTQLGAASQYGNIANSGLGEQNAQLAGAQQLAGLAGQQQQEQQIGLQGAAQFGTNAGLATQQQQEQLGVGSAEAALGNQVQQQALTGANATYNAGNQVQTQQQNELNAAYQQYLNQVNWPYQMLNVQESALSNSPYNIATAVTLPSANSTAQGFGTLTGAAGLLGSLAGSGGSTAPFGGQALAG